MGGPSNSASKGRKLAAPATRAGSHCTQSRPPKGNTYLPGIGAFAMIACRMPCYCASRLTIHGRLCCSSNQASISNAGRGCRVDGDVGNGCVSASPFPTCSGSDLPLTTPTPSPSTSKQPSRKVKILERSPLNSFCTGNALEALSLSPTTPPALCWSSRPPTVWARGLEHSATHCNTLQLNFFLSRRQECELERCRQKT